MKVGWIQDISRPHGGAECSNRTCVAAGVAMGHDIVGLTPDNFYPWVLKDADVLVINNFFQFQRPQFDAVLKEIWEKKKPYVVYSTITVNPTSAGTSRSVSSRSPV